MYLFIIKKIIGVLCVRSRMKIRISRPSICMSTDKKEKKCVCGIIKLKSIKVNRALARHNINA